jgi:hypothetical protein
MAGKDTPGNVMNPISQTKNRQRFTNNDCFSLLAGSGVIGNSESVYRAIRKSIIANARLETLRL